VPLLYSPNNIIDLRAAFDALHTRGYEICAFIGEPVMGEGNTGATMTPEFYKEIRHLCNQYDSMMIIDSIQAGLRCSGELSVVNYPEFKNTGVYPDMEVFSKAINAGQFPVSVLALNEKSSYKFVEGTYGNTMTGNPRGLHVVNTVLSMMTEDVKKNIVKQGNRLVEKFQCLAQKYPMCIKKVSGHGLSIGVQLTDRINCIDMENKCRKNGLNVIHSGYNSVRLTPVFTISDAEVDYIIQVFDKVLKENYA